jgi:hypothetical protein
MRYQVTTTLTPREALEQALADFGPGGLGLQITSQTNLSLGFQGGGGYIAVSAQPGAKTIVELETREWDYAVQRFMARVQTRLGQHHSISSMTCRPGPASRASHWRSRVCVPSLFETRMYPISIGCLPHGKERLYRMFCRREICEKA